MPSSVDQALTLTSSKAAASAEVEANKKMIALKSNEEGSSSQQLHQHQEEHHQMELWREVASPKGLSQSKLYLRKTVTITDAKKEQNRYEICLDEIRESMPLLELAIRSHSRPSVDVMVLDREGREYKMIFKFIPSNCRYRFMGSDWGRFMKDNGFKAEQIMRIYGLGDAGGGNYGFAFINTPK